MSEPTKETPKAKDAKEAPQENPNDAKEVPKKSKKVPKNVKSEEKDAGKTEKQESDDEPYDPFQHREVRKPTSDFGALAHMLKTSLGSGILAMPMAFKNSGLIFGSFGTILIGIICTYCVYMLVKCSQILCAKNRVPTMTYAETTVKAFRNGPRSAQKSAVTLGHLVTVQLLGSFILGSSVYVVIIAQTAFQVVEFLLKTTLHIRYYILMLWIPLILMVMIRDLKTLVPFSIIANIFVIVSFSIIHYYIFREIHNFSDVYFVAPFSRLPIFVTTVLFGIEGIGTVLSIENEMKNPGHFIGGRCPVAYISMSIVVIVYSLLGFFGYLQYGEDTEGSITLNLPLNDILAQVVKILIALAVYFTYGLQFYVPINLIYDMLRVHLKPKYHPLCNIMVRIGMVSSTIIIALAIPNLEPIITLVGAICFSSLGLLFPALIDTMTRYPNLGRFRWHLYKNIVISILSLTTLIAGTYTAILSIVRAEAEHSK